MEWDSRLYDNKHDFIAEYGKGLLEFVPLNRKQAILDLGCGTGTLTAQLASMCRKVVGADSSPSMIEAAKAHFPEIEFTVCDALALPYDKDFDIVFSNAVFHWITDHDALLKNIRRALKPHGMLICEFGAAGNIAAIENAFTTVYTGMGYPYRPKFNFPTAQEFGTLLEKNGFTAEQICDYDRPTVLKDGANGLRNWLKQFFASELEHMPEAAQVTALNEVEGMTRKNLWNGSEWIADYRRLRVVAHI